MEQHKFILNLKINFCPPKMEKIVLCPLNDQEREQVEEVQRDGMIFVSLIEKGYGITSRVDREDIIVTLKKGNIEFQVTYPRGAA